MCGIYCVYKQSRSCQLPFCASPIFHFEIGDFSVYIYIYIRSLTFTKTHATIIGASLSEPHLGPYSGCGLCHITLVVVVVVYNVISYVLAPVYKRLYFIRDVTS